MRGGLVIWVKKEKKLTQPASERNEEERYRRGLELYYYSRFKQQTVLLGIQDAAGANGTAGEWSFPSRTTAQDQFPGNLVLVLSASVLLVGPRDADAAQLFFFHWCRYPPGQFTYK